MAGGDLVRGHGVRINPGCADAMHWRAGVRPGAKQSYGGLMCKSTANPEHATLQGPDFLERSGACLEIFKHMFKMRVPKAQQVKVLGINA